MQPIYLDYNATTPIDPAVLEAMQPYLQSHFGNPSSTHAYGKTAHDAIDLARAQVASLIGAQPDEIIFTSGGTEASNHAIKGPFTSGSFFSRLSGSPHIITSAIEHPATLQPRGISCPARLQDFAVTGRSLRLVNPDAVEHHPAAPR